jgi:hypothetical protein
VALSRQHAVDADARRVCADVHAVWRVDVGGDCCVAGKQTPPRCSATCRALDDAVELYNFAFEYLRDDKKVLLVEEACVAWELLLKPKQWALFDEWLAFVRSGAHKAVARDPWQQVVPFARRYATREVAIATYDAENSAFNVLFDEFVEFLARDEKGSQRQN